MMVDTVLGLHSFVYVQTTLCHPLDSLITVPKDLRATQVPSFGKLNHSVASSTYCICSKWLLMKLYSHPLGNYVVLWIGSNVGHFPKH